MILIMSSSICEKYCILHSNLTAPARATKCSPVGFSRKIPREKKETMPTTCTTLAQASVGFSYTDA